MTRYDFTAKAQRQFLKLPQDLQQRLLLKIEHYLAQPDPLVFAKRYLGGAVPTYRFQIGDYRVIFERGPERILIVAVGHRRDVYR